MGNVSSAATVNALVREPASETGALQELVRFTDGGKTHSLQTASRPLPGHDWYLVETHSFTPGEWAYTGRDFTGFTRLDLNSGYVFPGPAMALVAGIRALEFRALERGEPIWRARGLHRGAHDGVLDYVLLERETLPRRTPMDDQVDALQRGLRTLRPSMGRPADPVSVTLADAERVALALAVNVDALGGLAWWRRALVVEMEHGSRFGVATNVTADDVLASGRIALAHLLEFPDYYQRLARMEREASAYWQDRVRPRILH